MASDATHGRKAASALWLGGFYCRFGAGTELVLAAGPGRARSSLPQRRGKSSNGMTGWPESKIAIHFLLYLKITRSRRRRMTSASTSKVAALVSKRVCWQDSDRKSVV